MFTSTQILIPQLRMMSDNGMLGFLPQEVDMGNIPDAVTKLTGSLVLLWLWNLSSSKCILSFPERHSPT